MTFTSPASAAAALALQYKAAQPPFAAFTGDKGRAWLVEGDNGPVGFIDTGDGPKEYADLTKWQADVEKADITTPEGSDAAAPAADAAPAAPAAPEPAATPKDAPAPADAPAAPEKPAAEKPAPTDKPADTPPADAAPADAPVDAPAPDAAPADAPADAPAAHGSTGDESTPVPVPKGAEIPLFGKSAEEPDEAAWEPTEDVNAENEAAPEGKALEVGDAVTWEGKSGRVDLIVTDGTVPGVEGDVEGTKDAPVARIVTEDGKAAVPVAALAVVAAEAEEEPYEPLAELAQESGLDVKTIIAAYGRGWAAYPGEAKTALTRDEWAMGRAEWLVEAAVDTELLCNDRDLL